MELKFTDSVLGLKESSTLAINQTVKAKRQRGESVFHFGFGQSPFPIHDRIKEALIENADNKDYLPTKGLPALREKISNFYSENFGCHISPDNIVIGPGSKELLFQSLMIVDGPLIIPSPSWVSYGPQAQLAKKHVHVVQTSIDNNYKITPEQLRVACHSLQSYQQKVLILNSPNNPSGAVYNEAEVKALVNVCRQYGVIVISDEIYSLVDFGVSKFSSFLKFYPEGTIVTNGLSKGHSAGGYRLGFLAVSEKLEGFIDILSSVVSETFSSVSSPVQYAAIEAFSDDAEVTVYVNQCTAIHKAVAQYMYDRFINMDLSVCNPQGAFYIYPSFHKFKEDLLKVGVKTSPGLAQKLLDMAGVAVLPGTDFYALESDLTVRVATVDYNGEEVFKESLNHGELDKEFVEKFCPNIKLGCDAIEAFLMDLEKQQVSEVIEEKNDEPEDKLIFDLM